MAPASFFLGAVSGHRFCLMHLLCSTASRALGSNFRCGFRNVRFVAPVGTKLIFRYTVAN